MLLGVLRCTVIRWQCVPMLQGMTAGVACNDAVSCGVLLLLWAWRSIFIAIRFHNASRSSTAAMLMRAMIVKKVFSHLSRRAEMLQVQ